MHLQWSSLVLLSCGLANAAQPHLPVAALITGNGNLIPRQEYSCPTDGVYTWCPGHEGCCSTDEPCFTSAGQAQCQAPCYGPTCADGSCCPIGYGCPPPGQQACIHTSYGSFPTSPPPIPYPSVSAYPSYDPGEPSYTPSYEPPPVTPGPTSSWGGYYSPTPEPEPSSLLPTSGSGQAVPGSGASMAAPFLAGLAPLFIWAFIFGIGLALVV